MITTLTLNPAFDIHVNIDSFNLGYENLAKSLTRDIGGKGINISRALNENGITNHALIVIGNENGDEFKSKLAEDGIIFDHITVSGRIRENITIHPQIGKETRLSFKGFSCDSSLLSVISEKIDISDGDIVTFTGSVPSGISPEAVEYMLMSLKERGAKIVIDSKSINLDSIKKIKPMLIKPNEEEIHDYFGNLEEYELLKTACKLYNEGIENVIISLGSKGALLACKEGVFRVDAPKINAVSTIGAGDSMIAGFISAYVKGMNASDTLAVATAYGSAACLREGTNPPLADDIAELLTGITVQKVIQ